MDADSSPLSEITQLDAAVQRLLTLRSEHGRGATHPLLKQTLAQIDQAIEELQVMFEEVSQGRDDVQRVIVAIDAERARRVELMESLSVACVFTDEGGTILEANTSAFLLLGVSVDDVGRASLCDAAVDREACAAMLARGAADGAVVATLALRQSGRVPVTVSMSGAAVRNVHPPIWRWFIQRPAAR